LTFKSSKALFTLSTAPIHHWLTRVGVHHNKVDAVINIDSHFVEVCKKFHLRLKINEAMSLILCTWRMLLFNAALAN